MIRCHIPSGGLKDWATSDTLSHTQRWVKKQNRSLVIRCVTHTAVGLFFVVVLFFVIVF